MSNYVPHNPLPTVRWEERPIGSALAYRGTLEDLTAWVVASRLDCWTWRVDRHGHFLDQGDHKDIGKAMDHAENAILKIRASR